ncbi:LytR/AlgR family response regulator transcription factor [Flavobacterium humi]|uniref:Response regulator transcription factor n=1 Tax=Flavobacterium humi TaxID=2562683 RepID=A0A4Z0LAU4_9FLAO|nr:LytTR family DNA-binding domain-containing protein [Flavobacterium humi]TGD58893.1 response regulator transcription factor [Flavobacterium humi]
MIKVVIIEDEIPARKKLKRFLEGINEPVTVIAEIGIVTEAIAFLKTNPSIDLILSDIELQDGNAFEIYNEVTVSCPIIFTTAYNQFLMDAFEGNGIEYLLKPFSFERFQKAWDKFLWLRKSNTTDTDLYAKLSQIITGATSEKTVKKRFSVPSNQGTYFIETGDILFFAAEEGVIFAVDKHSKKHLLTQSTLKEIEEVLDKSDFFRINRSELANKKHIERMDRYTKNTIAIKLRGYEKYLVTSQSNTSLFREWIEE